jgi:hypothetical protein
MLLPKHPKKVQKYEYDDDGNETTVSAQAAQRKYETRIDRPASVVLTSIRRRKNAVSEELL